MEQKMVYSEREKLFLVELIAGEKHIENKQTDGTTLSLKNEAWERVTVVFNSQGFSCRTTKQLKKCWENIKQRKRKLNTVIRQEQLLTGGGPPVNVVDDPVMDMVDTAAPYADVEIHCPYDSTSGYEQQHQASTPSSSSTTNAYYDVSTPDKKRRKVKGEKNDLEVNDERTLRVTKLQEAIIQQRELHKERMQTAKMENLLAVLRVKQQLAEMKSELDTSDIDLETFNPKDFL